MKYGFCVKSRQGVRNSFFEKTQQLPGIEGLAVKKSLSCLKNAHDAIVFGKFVVINVECVLKDCTKHGWLVGGLVGWSQTKERC